MPSFIFIFSSKNGLKSGEKKMEFQHSEYM